MLHTLAGKSDTLSPLVRNSVRRTNRRLVKSIMRYTRLISSSSATPSCARQQASRRRLLAAELAADPRAVVDRRLTEALDLRLAEADRLLALASKRKAKVREQWKEGRRSRVLVPSLLDLRRLRGTVDPGLG